MRLNFGPYIKVSLSNLMFLGLVFIYIPLFPITGECQPIFPLLISVLILGRSFFIRDSRLQHVDKKIFLCFAIITLVLLRAIFDLLSGIYFDLTYILKYTIGPIVFITTYLYLGPVSFFIIRRIVYLNLLLLILSLIPPFYPLTVAFANWISRGVVYDSESLRGFAFFSPEPSYAATYLFFIVLIVLQSLKRDSILLIHKYKLLLLLTILILATKSLTGYFFIVILVSYFFNLKFLQRPRVLFPFLFFLCLVGYILLHSERLIIYSSLLENIDFANVEIFSTLCLLDPSPSTRIITNLICYYGGLTSLFGHGLGSFSYLWLNYISDLNLEFIARHEVLSNSYIFGLNITPQTYLGSFIFDFGLLGALLYSSFLYVVLFENANTTNNKALRRVMILTLLVFSFFQSQVSNPMIWYLLALYAKTPKLLKV